MLPIMLPRFPIISNRRRLKCEPKEKLDEQLTFDWLSRKPPTCFELGTKLTLNLLRTATRNSLLDDSLLWTFTCPMTVWTKNAEKCGGPYRVKNLKSASQRTPLMNSWMLFSNTGRSTVFDFSSTRLSVAAERKTN